MRFASSVFVLVGLVACGESLPVTNDAPDGSSPPATDASSSDASSIDAGADGAPTLPLRKLYVIGGTTATTASAKTFIGTIDGRELTWTEGPALAAPLDYACGGSIGDRVIAGLGQNGVDLVDSSAIDVAAAQPAWIATGGPSQKRKETACFETSAGVYFAGGGAAFSTQQFATTDLAASASATGPVTWTAAGDLPKMVQAASAVVAQGHAFVLGGFPCTKSTAVAPIANDGTLGAWSSGTDLPESVYAATAVADGDRIYLVGGLSGTGCATGSAAVTMLRVASTGAIVSTAGQTPMRDALNYARAAIVNGRIYVVGGNTGGGTIAPTRAVISAEIGPEGTLGAWRDENGLPSAVARFAMVVR